MKRRSSVRNMQTRAKRDLGVRMWPNMYMYISTYLYKRVQVESLKQMDLENF